MKVGIAVLLAFVVLSALYCDSEAAKRKSFATKNKNVEVTEEERAAKAEEMHHESLKKTAALEKHLKHSVHTSKPAVVPSEEEHNNEKRDYESQPKVYFFRQRPLLQSARVDTTADELQQCLREEARQYFLSLSVDDAVRQCENDRASKISELEASISDFRAAKASFAECFNAAFLCIDNAQDSQRSRKFDLITPGSLGALMGKVEAQLRLPQFSATHVAANAKKNAASTELRQDDPGVPPLSLDLTPEEIRFGLEVCEDKVRHHIKYYDARDRYLATCRSRSVETDNLIITIYESLRKYAYYIERCQLDYLAVFCPAETPDITPTTLPEPTDPDTTPTATPLALPDL